MNKNTGANSGKDSRKKTKTIIRTTLEVLLLLALLWILFISTGRSLCQIALNQLGKLTNTKIKAGSIKFKPDGSVVIKELVIRPKKKADYDNAILKAQTLRTRFNLGSVLLLRPRLKRVVISKPIFSVTYDTETGRWNLSGLKIATPKTLGGELPIIHLNKGKLLYNKISGEQQKNLVEIDFNCKFVPAPNINRYPDDSNESRAVYNFEIETGQWSRIGESNLRGQYRPGRIEINGKIKAGGKNEDVITADNLNALLNYKSNKDYSLKLDIKDLTSKKRAVDEDFTTLRSLLPERISAFETLQKVFNRFRPGGQIDLKIDFSGNSGRLKESKLNGNVYCKDVWFCNSQFKYPISELKGQIDVTEKSATLNNLQGRHANVKLCFNGWTEKNNGQQEYHLQITSDNMLLDEDLYKALSTQQQNLWDDFSPIGTVSINENMNEISGKKTSSLSITLLNNQARWRHFPYPLRNMSGLLLFDSNEITFADVVSRSGEEKITINGKVSSYESGKALYDIEISADNIDASFLRSEEYSRHIGAMLPKHLVKTINELQVKGNVNFRAHLNNQKEREHLDYNMAVDFLGNSIDYTKIAYPFRDVTGSIKIKNEGIKLENVTGTAANNIQITAESSMIKINGEIKTAENTFGEAVLQLEANDISLDERLGAALPENLKNIYFDMSPTGRINVNFPSVRIFTASDGAKYISLRGLTEFKGCNFNISPTITELNGPVKIEGLYKSGHGFCEGHVELKNCSMRIKDKLLTELKVDMVYDDKLRDWKSTLLTANCYDGAVAGRFELAQPKKNEASYVLDVGFYDIDLGKFLSDPYHYEQQEAALHKKHKNNGSSGYSQGNLNGSLSLSSGFGDEAERIGRCRLKITDMRVGKLSPIAKLQYILKLTEPKDFAFEQMVVDSYVKNNNLFLRKVDLSGEAIAFSGMGQIDLQNSYIDLILTARGHRLVYDSPGVFQSLTESLGQGIVRLNVIGNVYEPKVIKETLPVIKGPLYLLGTKKNEEQ